MIYISFDIGIKNLALCILEYDDDVLSILDWRIICLSDSKKSIKGANRISEILYLELDNIIGSLEEIGIHHIDKVIIENQPSNLNGIMKTIQMLIFAYFSLLKHWDQKVDEVILINAVHKLQNHAYTPSSKSITDSHNSINKREKYKLNKTDSIEICRHYIQNCTELQDIFNSNKKKDDLADTCIQVVSYLRKSGHDIQAIIKNLKYLS